MSISVKTRKTLWAKSGNRCAICQKELVLEKDQFDVILNLGEECHIVSSQDNGPRHEVIPNFDYDQTDNLILLCSNDHKMIDERVEFYQKNYLKIIKEKHEAWVRNTLDNPKEKITKEISVQENLLAFMVNKNQKITSMKYSTEALYHPKSLDLAFTEVGELKQHIKDFISKSHSMAPDLNIIARDNQHHICDVMLNGFSLLCQFYQAYGNMALNSYLLFAIVKGYFDKHGRSDPFNPVTKQELIRLEVSCDNTGKIVWRDKQNKEQYFESGKIADIWLDKFIRKSLK
ncbi:HNH endonuclease [Flavobacterium notoginsengisoli]|uniref:HNH endonuclease n=1 Tax=Flavobacterium notoginsengisoli TaxID=1478199 RepID=UPI003628302A